MKNNIKWKIEKVEGGKGYLFKKFWCGRGVGQDPITKPELKDLWEQLNEMFGEKKCQDCQDSWCRTCFEVSERLKITNHAK